MQKAALTLALFTAFSFSSTASAHPECPKLNFWDKTPNSCEPHHHEETTLVGAEEKHIVYFSFDSAEVGSIQDIVKYIDTLKQLDSVTLVGHAAISKRGLPRATWRPGRAFWTRSNPLSGGGI